MILTTWNFFHVCDWLQVPFKSLERIERYFWTLSEPSSRKYCPSSHVRVKDCTQNYTFLLPPTWRVVDGRQILPDPRTVADFEPWIKRFTTKLEDQWNLKDPKTTVKLLITQIPKPYVFFLPLTIDSKQWPGNGPATRITFASIPWGRGEGRGREEYEDYLLLSSSPSLAV